MFALIKGSVEELDTSASPFCALFLSLFLQSAPNATVATTRNQATRLRYLQQTCMISHYFRTNDSNEYIATLLAFCDAGRLVGAVQICHIGELLLDDLNVGSTFHEIACFSHRAHRPVRFTGAAEIILAGEHIDIGKIIAQTHSLLLALHTPLVVVVESEDLFKSLTTRRQSIDRSIRGDNGVVRFEFETTNVSKIISFPEKLNLPDVETSLNSLLLFAIAQMLSTGKIPFSPFSFESCSSHRPLGQRPQIFLEKEGMRMKRPLLAAFYPTRPLTFNPIVLAQLVPVPARKL